MTGAPDNGSAAKAEGWRDAWPDLLAFVIGLGLAWKFEWETRDLVWSLWLSSFVIGYAMIVWGVFRPAVVVVREASGNGASLAAEAGIGGLFFAGGLFMLAFFTVHFGGFHFVHSVFLNQFFPVEPGLAKSSPNLALYWEVFKRYWWFLPAAAIAERSAFRLRPAGPAPANDTSVTAEAIAARKARNAANVFGSGSMMEPYKNVFRMHLLIFFFAFAHFAKFENFWVYAIVYAVYFFPWRLLKKG
jgi:hypothetical protein